MRIHLKLLIIALILSSCGDSARPKENQDDLEIEQTNSVTEEDNDSEEMVNLKPLRACIDKANFKSPLVYCLTDFKTELDNAEPYCVDSILFLTIDRMNKLASEVYFDDNKDLVKDTWELKPELIKKYKAQGFAIDQEEGMYFLTPDYAYLQKVFGDVVTTETSNYLKYRQKNPIKISYDAGLILEPMEYADRLIRLEELIPSENPVLREIIKDELLYEAHYFFHGMDNTPVYDWESFEALPEFKKALSYLRGSGGKYTRKLAEYYYKYLLENGWVIEHETYNKVVGTAEEEKWLNKFYPNERIYVISCE